MEVLYSVRSEPASLIINEAEDLPTAFIRIKEQLLSSHPELAETSDFAVRIADSLLEALADDVEQVSLGELLALQDDVPHI